MVANHYRWDFIGLSTDDKPTADNPKVTDGSTYYESDTSKLYIWFKNQWYEKTVEGGGGGGEASINVVQTTGTSTEDVMSQDATTKLIYPDITNYPYKMKIGEGSIESNNIGAVINGVLASTSTSGSLAIGTPYGSMAQIGVNGRAMRGVAIGNSSGVGRGDDSIAIGYNSYSNSGQNIGYNIALGANSYAGNGTANSTVALGAYAKTTRTGEVNIGTGSTNTGYNSTDYRVLGGVHDGVQDHDVVTVGQLNTAISGVGSVKYLTKADYNYPVDNPTSLALWLLDEGQYVINVDGEANYQLYAYNGGLFQNSNTWGVNVFIKPTSSRRGCYQYTNGSTNPIYSKIIMDIDSNGLNGQQYEFFKS